MGRVARLSVSLFDVAVPPLTAPHAERPGRRLILEPEGFAKPGRAPREAPCGSAGSIINRAAATPPPPPGHKLEH